MSIKAFSGFWVLIENYQTEVWLLDPLPGPQIS